MKKFGICLDYRRGIWKSFYPALRQAKGNAGKLEDVYEISLMPAEAIAPLNPHMIISKNENLKHLEDMFSSQKKAQKAYEKTGLNLSSGLDIMPVWKIFKVNKANNNREKVYETQI